MKKLLGLLILLLVMGLAACGTSSTNSDSEECDENPSLCPTQDSGSEPESDPGAET